MEISELRQEIDGLDREIVSLVQRRMDVAAAIAAYKRERHLPVLDEKREREKLQSVSDMCRGELKGYVAELYTGLMRLSREYQSALMEKEHG